MTDPDEGNSAQSRRAQDAYQAWKKMDFIAQDILASSMNDDLLYEYKQYPTAYVMWNALKKKFGCTLVTKLRQLIIKFDTYKKHPNHTIQQHLREISNMITELKSAGHFLSDE